MPTDAIKGYIMKRTLIVNGLLTNEGRSFHADLLLEGGYISRIDKQLAVQADQIIDAAGMYVLPGVIDDQVHFREPGHPRVATIASESRAAIAGGVTSYMEMPNTVPPTTTLTRLEEKYALAARSSHANYSFYMGTTHENAEEAVRVNPKNVCGIKIFMGSSTGNMLVEDEKALHFLFERTPVLLATHCEKEGAIRQMTAQMRAVYGDDIPMEKHPEIRHAEACYASTAHAIALANAYGSRLNVLHISTEKELSLFPPIPIGQKTITAEVCVHHLWFSKADYRTKGGYIKTNPAIKEKSDREALWEALLTDCLDIIASDHAPHAASEKEKGYLACPSGMPMVGHTLLAMLEKEKEGKIPRAKIVEKMCHAPARVYGVKKRGFLREGYYADIVVVDPQKSWLLRKEDLHYRCGWSALVGHTFHHTIAHTIVSGHLSYSKGRFSPQKGAKRLEFLCEEL